MKYSNPKVESSYQKNNLGKTLYETVLKYKPKIIIEFGVLNAYSTIAMAMALDELGEGKIKAYDLFEDYQYKHSTLERVGQSIDAYGLSNYVELEKRDFYGWLENPEQFDLLHVDISNKGDTVERLYEGVKSQIAKGSIVLFEGGSLERDNIEWMSKYQKKKITEAKITYEVINTQFPSLSRLKIKK